MDVTRPPLPQPAHQAEPAPVARPVPAAAPPGGVLDQRHRDMLQLQLAEALPLMLVSLLERRYLTELEAHRWQLEAAPNDEARPLLREVTAMARPEHAEAWARAMPHVLTACHEPGHTLMMVLHGTGTRHRLYLGARRVPGAGARSTTDYLAAQASAFRAYFSGLSLGAVARLDDDGLPELASLLQTAPALAAITGIPSGRGAGRGAGGLPVPLQSLDRLVRAVGDHRYALVVAAEPLPPLAVDGALDRCRRLRSEVHTYTRTSVVRSAGHTEGAGRTERPPSTTGWKAQAPTILVGLAVIPSIIGAFTGAPAVGSLAQFLMSMGFFSNQQLTKRLMDDARQISTGESWSESSTVELLNTNAEACEHLLTQHIDRLQHGRSGGWWRMAVYVAAESEAGVRSVAAALRSLASGDASALDPIRPLFLPPHMLREAAERGQILGLRPREGEQGHPLGQPYDALATCVNSEELAVLVNLPQHELPGLPMRDMGEFALTAPPPTERCVTLGYLCDAQGRDLGPVTITDDVLNRHVFVTGTTGFGKTNTCMRLLLEAHTRLGVPFLVVEPAKAEYRRLVETRELRQRLRVFSIGGDSPRALRLNPLALVPGVPLGLHIDLLKAVFNASFAMFAGMPQVLEEAILDVYTERGWSLFTSENRFLRHRHTLDELAALTPCLEDLHDQIELVMIRKGYATEVRQNMGAALRSRLKGLMVGNKGLMLNTSRSTPLRDLFEHPTVIELKNLGDDEEKAFVMALIFARLYEHAEVRQRDIPASRRGTLQHLTLIEEAHRLLRARPGQASAEVGDPRSKAVSMFTDMLAEMRAYGEGFIIADQVPTALAPETLKNSNLKIVHRLNDPHDRQIVGSSINLTERQIRHLNTLSPGFAVVHDERIGEAVLTHVARVKETQVPDLGEAQLRRSLAAVDPVERAYLFRHAGCAGCPAPCRYFHRLVEAGGEAAHLEALRPCFEALLLDDAETAWALWAAWRGAAGSGDAARGRDRAAEAADAWGPTYCAAAQAAHRWLAELLLARMAALPGAAAGVAEQAGLANQLLPAEERSLDPAQRLTRDRAARALAELLATWAVAPELTEVARDAFAGARGRLIAVVAAAPPIERAGCAECPARCIAVHLVAPHVGRLGGGVAAKVADNVSADSRLHLIGRHVTGNSPALARHAADGGRWRHLLYCLLVHTPVAPPAEPQRAELLELLR